MRSGLCIEEYGLEAEYSKQPVAIGSGERRVSGWYC
jgi:hypothetical protein